MGFKLIGIAVFVLLIVAGVYWLYDNVQLRKRKR